MGLGNGAGEGVCDRGSPIAGGGSRHWQRRARASGGRVEPGLGAKRPGLGPGWWENRVRYRIGRHWALGWREQRGALGARLRARALIVCGAGVVGCPARAGAGRGEPRPRAAVVSVQCVRRRHRRPAEGRGGRGRGPAPTPKAAGGASAAPPRVARSSCWWMGRGAGGAAPRRALAMQGAPRKTEGAGGAAAAAARVPRGSAGRRGAQAPRRRGAGGVGPVAARAKTRACAHLRARKGY
jgi:hypothetical protein